MRIGIDCTLFQRDRYTGVENYTLHLIKSLLHADTLNQYIFFFRKEIPNALASLDKSRFEAMISPTSNRLITDQVWLPWAVRKARVNLLHCPAFPSPLLVRAPTVLTIHDAVPWRYPATISKGMHFYYRPLFPKAIRKAKRIIADSFSTRNDLIAIFPYAKDKVKVIHLSGDPHLFSDNGAPARSSNSHSKAKRYLLTVGSIEPRKNLLGLIRAFELAAPRIDADIHLMIVGRKAWQKNVLIPQTIKDRVIFTGYIPSNQALAEIYRNALLFVLPSFYEGFGLPVLEAMWAGIPVLCSRTSSLPEVAGDAAEYADPWKPEHFAEKMVRLLQNTSLREDLIMRGHERSRLFSWEKTAQETLAVYADAV
jgi:glycosyltransferase involved in cell wall biosynthesis